MKKILITGANGFLAHYLIKIFIRDYDVIGIGKGLQRMHCDEKKFHYISCDFTDEEEILKIVEEHQPDFIIHAGAISKPDECELKKEKAYNTNVKATQYLLTAAAKTKSFFLFVSTDFIFDGVHGMYVEDSPTGPVNYYGQTKLEAEAFVKAYLFNWCIVRTVLVYGHPRGGRENILTTVTAKIKNGEEVKIFNDQLRTPTYVEDLAGAIKTIIDKRATGIFHISGEDVLTPYEMAVAAAKHLNLNEKLIKIVTEKDFDQPARRPLKTGFDISKAKSLLGYNPISFQEGLRKTFED